LLAYILLPAETANLIADNHILVSF